MTHTEAQLLYDALVMAIWRRGKPDAFFITPIAAVHQRTVQRLLADHGVVCAMNRSGNGWDDAAMESFFSSLKTERTGPRNVQDPTRRES